MTYAACIFVGLRGTYNISREIIISNYQTVNILHTFNVYNVYNTCYNRKSSITR